MLITEELIYQKIGITPEPLEKGEQGWKIRVPKETILRVCTRLKEMGFSWLTTITAISYENTIDMVYMLESWEQKKRIRVFTELPLDNPVIYSVTYLWSGADWLEREVFDMFGVDFIYHPNLIRIFMPDDFDEYPLRKSYVSK
jgi:NADH-quinone oxidoreductase subunit C